MNANDHELILKEEAFQVVGAAIEVANQLGCGFLEAVYQEAMEVELAARKLPYIPQQRIPIFYKGTRLSKEYVADFLCYDQIIVEIKAIRAITVMEEAQLLNYLHATHLPLGLLINFGAPRLEWKRYVNTTPNIRVHSCSFAVPHTQPPP